ncbi:MAG TPA: hypothetical protein VLX61_02230 [Anaerolineales bacterium]|nr:hypothetical protein [Anaerolineales bacterium]
MNEELPAKLSAGAQVAEIDWAEVKNWKTDDAKKQTPRKQSARAEIIQALRSEGAKSQYGFDNLVSNEDADKFTRDGAGDQLDALARAVRAHT